MPDSYSTLAGDTLTVPAPGVRLNDQNISAGLSAIRQGNATGGTPVLNADGSFTFTPMPGFTGTASFPYCYASAASFPGCVSNVAIVSIDVTAPVAVPESYTTLAGDTLTVPAPGVRGNDQNIGSNLYPIVSGQPVGGTPVLNADGSFTFTPLPDFKGAASFSYCYTQAGVFPNCVSNHAIVSIGVTAPVAVPDSYTTLSGQVLTVPAPGVRGNDQNIGANLSPIRAGNAIGGTPLLNADGSFTFTPDPGFKGTASFPYCYTRFFPNCVSNVAVVTIEIPAPVAVNDSYVTPQGQPITVPAPGVRANDQNIPPNLSAIRMGDATGGTPVLNTDGSFTFTPAPGFSGLASFPYCYTQTGVFPPTMCVSNIATVEIFVSTQQLSGDIVGPITIQAGQAVLITNARVVGPVTVNPGGALSVVNSSISRGITATAPSYFSLCRTSVSPSPSGTALSVTGATAPIRIGDPAVGCAGNRFAGQVNLSSNAGVTFGANMVSQSATIDNNGPGATIVKGNTVIGALACARNNPPPTNAGQTNTAGAKAGQCAGL